MSDKYKQTLLASYSTDNRRESCVNCVCFCSPVGRVHPLRLPAAVSVRHLCLHGLFLLLHRPGQDRGPVCPGGARGEGEEEEERGDDQEGLGRAPRGEEEEL